MILALLPVRKRYHARSESSKLHKCLTVMFERVAYSIRKAYYIDPRRP